MWKFVAKALALGFGEYLALCVVNGLIVAVVFMVHPEYLAVPEQYDYYIFLLCLFVSYVLAMAVKTMYMYKKMHYWGRAIVFLVLPQLLWFNRDITGVRVFLIGLVVISALSWYQVLVLRGRAKAKQADSAKR